MTNVPRKMYVIRIKKFSFCLHCIGMHIHDFRNLSHLPNCNDNKKKENRLLHMAITLKAAQSTWRYCIFPNIFLMYFVHNNQFCIIGPIRNVSIMVSTFQTFFFPDASTPRHQTDVWTCDMATEQDGQVRKPRSMRQACTITKMFAPSTCWLPLYV